MPSSIRERPLLMSRGDKIIIPEDPSSHWKMTRPDWAKGKCVLADVVRGMRDLKEGQQLPCAGLEGPKGEVTRRGAGGREAAEQSGDVLGTDLGWSGHKNWQEWAFSSAIAEDFMWQALWCPCEVMGSPGRLLDREGMSWCVRTPSGCWHAERRLS